MMIPEQISNQILEVRNLLEEILNEVQNDALRYNEIQISKQSNYQYLLNSIDSNQLEKCLIDSKYLNVDREVFNGIVSTINAYKNYYNRNQKKFESFDLGKLYEVYLNINFDKEIAIFKNDVLEVEDSKNPLPAWEKEKLIIEFSGKIDFIEKSRVEHVQTFGWFFINYYKRFLEKFQKLETMINSYFPEKILENSTDIFDRNFINELYNICVENVIFKPENISFENFYLIINEREPKKNCMNKIDRKTVFAFPIKNLSKKIGDSKERENWIEYVCDHFTLKQGSVNSHGDKKSSSTKVFYELFNIEIEDSLI